MKHIFYFTIVVLLFNNTINAQIIGSVDVNPGWNLIGSLSSGDISEIITTVPPDIILGNWYGYNSAIGGYYIADILESANGYWIKVTQTGTIYFAQSTTFICGTSQVDYQGKIYNTVQIGTQCWLKENLDVGTMILGEARQVNNGIIEKYCYDDTQNNCNLYGGLYEWDEAMQYVTTPGTQGICPPNWHIPTYSELQTLGTIVSGDGNALKAVGQGSGGGAGTNTSGFSALLSGMLYRNQTMYNFYDLTFHTYFWSSTQNGIYYAGFMKLDYNNSNITFMNDYEKIYGYSIRCLKD